ncbi:hypothetical protein G7Y89_g6620 [Cudoniella acicularis]|uniref:Uncharacterized protein n=1 Tax=Cudoniella acicularis TaxID=354080 RepID=A0A8H4RK50_9HELO|nr:hypothetical protein G7Y89_g6620 [Cudoniella acicularis]
MVRDSQVIGGEIELKQQLKRTINCLAQIVLEKPIETYNVFMRRSPIDQGLVLGKAKVMSYEDLQEARAKRTRKEAAKGVKSKGRRGQKRKSATPEVEEATADTARRGRKRKSAVLEAEAPEPKAKVARISKAPAPARASIAQTSEAQAAEDEIVPGPWRAPVAQMY